MEILNWLQDLLVVLWSFWQTQFVVGHIAVNVVVALVAAVDNKEFEFAKLGDFLWEIVKYLAIFLVAMAFGDGMGLGWLATAVFGLIETKLMSKTLENLKSLGVPIPDSVVTLFKK